MLVLKELSLQNRVIEIHDSELDRITIEDGAAVLYFPHVYIHSSEGRPAIDPGKGWSQQAIIRIGDARVEGEFSCESREGCGAAHRLSVGHIEIDGSMFDNLIPIPLDVLGAVELRLECWGEVIQIRGTSAKLELIGTAEYVEEVNP